MADRTAPEVIGAILDEVGIRRVVWVDNDNNSGKPTIDAGYLWSQLSQIPEDVVREVLGPVADDIFTDDPDVFEARFRRYWEKATEEEKKALHLRIQTANVPTNLEDSENDLAGVEEIPLLFAKYGPIQMGLEEWRKKASDVYKTCDTEPTLILFDRSFETAGVGVQDDVGIDLVRDALGQSVRGLVCCLISHLFHEKSLNTEWVDVAKRIGKSQSEVVPIPKELLREKPALVATLIKLAFVAPHYDKMRSRVLALTTACVQRAHDEVQSLNYMDLDRMIFRASDKEGVWEPDTLLRVFGISLRAATKVDVMKDKDMWDASAFIRKVSQVATPPGEETGDSVWKLIRSENYEEAESVNGLHRPTDLGDIYMKGNKKYILIAPQCDLMVRTKQGFRGNGGADQMKEVTLAVITDDNPHRLGRPLDFFERDRQVYVDFKNTVSVRLMCLDLCVFNDGGLAKFSLKDEPSELLIPAWKLRHSIVRKELERLLEKLKKINPDAKHRDSVASLLARVDNLGEFTGNLSLDESSIQLNFKRVARLLPPRSTSLVKAYCEFLNRDAFERTLGDIG